MSGSDGNAAGLPAGGPPADKPRRESRLGIALTAALCLMFLYFWFRPDAPDWQQEPVPAIVDRALAEPPPDSPAGRLLLDFDLMETALVQAGLGMNDEGLATAGSIAAPVVQALTIRQLAQSHLNDDAPHMGDALAMCDRIADPALREEMRDEILLQIASLGFPDAVLPEVRTAGMKAKLARRLAETDDRDTARRLLGELEAMLPSLPDTEADVVRQHLAWTRVSLALTDGPDQAVPAIEARPPDERPSLWKNLFGWCSSRGETLDRDLRLILSHIDDPDLRRSLELESLQSGHPLTTPEAMFAGLEAAVASAAPGADRVRAQLNLADARYRTDGDAASVPPLQAAIAEAAKVTDPEERTRLHADLAAVLPGSLLMAEAQAAKKTAIAAVRDIAAPDRRFPLLVRLAGLSFNAGDAETAQQLATDARELAASSDDTEARVDLAGFLTRLGDWPSAASLPETAETPAARDAILRECAVTVAEECIGYSPSDPPRRGQPLDRIRGLVMSANPENEAKAVEEVRAQPAGLARARAWLAVAKGRLLSAVPLDEALANPDDAIPAGFSDEFLMNTEDPAEIVEPEPAAPGPESATPTPAEEP